MKNKNTETTGWQPFEQMAQRYDTWFDKATGSRIFKAELTCLRHLTPRAPRPWLEVGVGTGRFAAALGVDEGVDPSSAVLRYARRRGIKCKKGQAEKLPYADSSFGTLLMITTICFLADPDLALRECHRVTRSAGILLMGFVPRNSAWGKKYMEKSSQPGSFYSVARFYTQQQVIRMTENAGFKFERGRGCLHVSPAGLVKNPRQPLPTGDLLGAGFVTLRFRKNAGQ